MSEYQYYEWQTIDRILTAEEQDAVNDLSSHIEVSSSRAVVTYHWSSFRHDPMKVLCQYFDAFFYIANWGSVQLMFRFPKGLIDEANLDPYLIHEYISFDTCDGYLVLDIDFCPEDGGGWIDEIDANLSRFIALRTDILEGDYRLLYLSWLKAMTMFDDGDNEYEDEDVDNPFYDHEPPVPPGLKKLSPSLQNFVQVFEIDPFLVQAAAENSPEPQETRIVDYSELVNRLSRDECLDFLTRLAEGAPDVGLKLRKRLVDFLPPQEDFQATEPRTIQQLLERAKHLKTAEKKRQAEAARQRHVAEMKALAKIEEQTWKKVDDLLENGRRIASVYDEATSILEKLKQLSEFQDTRDIFQGRIRQLSEKYARRPGLIGRWHTRGWV